MRLVPLLCLIAACIAPLTPDHVCGEVLQAVSLRTFQCTNDSELANQRYDQLADATECVAASEDSGFPGRGMHCAEQILLTPCADAKTSGDKPGFWIERDPTCASVFQLTQPSTTDPTGPLTQWGTCDVPVLVDLEATPIDRPVVIALEYDFVDQAVESCPAIGESGADIVFEVRTSRAGPIDFSLTVPAASSTPLYSVRVVTPDEGCDGQTLACVQPPYDTFTRIYTAPAGPHRTLVLLQYADPWQREGQVVRIAQRAP